MLNTSILFCTSNKPIHYCKSSISTMASFPRCPLTCFSSLIIGWADKVCLSLNVLLCEKRKGDLSFSEPVCFLVSSFTHLLFFGLLKFVIIWLSVTLKVFLPELLSRKKRQSPRKGSCKTGRAQSALKMHNSKKHKPGGVSVHKYVRHTRKYFA